jgi:isoleucyl-tRNA synthetase
LPEALVWESHAGWVAALEFRQEVLRHLERAKGQESAFKNPLDAGVKARVTADMSTRLKGLEGELADLCGVSRLQLEVGTELEIQIQDLRDEPRCQRSWKRDGTVRIRSDGGLLSDRDAAVLGL